MTDREIPKIYLAPSEIRMAGSAGNGRQEAAIQRSLDHEVKGTAGARQVHGWGNNAHGVACEMALSKHLNVYYLPQNTDKGDVGPYQVRGTDHYRGGLILRPGTDEDYKQSPFVLVAGPLPFLEVMGWMWGHEAMKPQWFGDHNNRNSPCWTVPWKLTHDLTTLPHWNCLGEVKPKKERGTTWN